MCRTIFRYPSISIVLAVLISSLPLLSPTYWGDVIDAGKAGLFGDFVGGYIGTIALLVSLFMVYRTYKDQKASNERMMFEGRFFELLRYHRENVSEIDLEGRRGHRAFIHMIREYRMALKLIDMTCKELKIEYSGKMSIELAYYAIYYGRGRNSTRILENAVDGHNPLVVANYFIKCRNSRTCLKKKERILQIA